MIAQQCYGKIARVIALVASTQYQRSFTELSAPFALPSKAPGHSIMVSAGQPSDGPPPLI
jgi:hypothetical protein